MSLDNRDFEQEFIDSSWEHMRSLLEVEKPVEKKKDYRFVFLALFLLLSTVGSLWFVNAHQGSIEPVMPAQMTTKADIALLPQNDNKLLSLAETTITSKSALNTNNGSLINTKPTIAVQNKKADNAIIQTKQAIQTSSDLIVAQKANIPQTLKHSISDSNIELKGTIENIASIDRIASKLVYDERRKKSSHGEIVLLNKKEKIKAISALGLVSSVSTNRYFAGLGLSMNVNFPISDKISFYTGTDLIFNNKVKDHIQTPPKNVVPLEPEKPGNPIITNHFDNYDSGVDIVTPVGINYNATKHLVLSTGINHRYNIYNKLVIDNSNGKNGLRYNRQFLSPTFGVSYNMNKAHISLSYEHGLKDFLSNNYSGSVSHRNSYIGLSTRFYLN